MDSIPVVLAEMSSLVLGVLVVDILVAALLVFNFISIYVRALAAGAPVGFFTLVFMRLRGVPPGLIVLR